MAKQKTLEDYKLDLKVYQTAKADLLKGISVEEVAKKSDLSERIVNKMRDDDYYTHNIEKMQNRIDHIESIAKDFRNGLTLNELADKYETSKQNISRILKMADVDRKEGGISKQRKVKLEMIKLLHERGETIESICQQLDLEEEIVRNYAYHLNITLASDTKHRVDELTQKVLDLRQEGATQTAIAKILGVSQSYVSKILLNNDERTFQSYEDYKERDMKIKEMYDSGIDIKEIMEEMQLTESNVRRILYKLNDDKHTIVRKKTTKL